MEPFGEAIASNVPAGRFTSDDGRSVHPVAAGSAAMSTAPPSIPVNPLVVSIAPAASAAAAARSSRHGNGSTRAPRPSAMSTDVVNTSTSTMISTAQCGPSARTPSRLHSTRRS